MLPFGMTIPASVPQRSEIPEGLMNYPVYKLQYIVLLVTVGVGNGLFQLPDALDAL
jgi:hypothetical protein